MPVSVSSSRAIYDALKAGGVRKFGLASLCHLDRLPPVGAVVIAAPLKIVNASRALCCASVTADAGSARTAKVRDSTAAPSTSSVTLNMPGATCGPRGPISCDGTGNWMTPAFWDPGPPLPPPSSPPPPPPRPVVALARYVARRHASAGVGGTV